MEYIDIDLYSNKEQRKHIKHKSKKSPNKIIHSLTQKAHFPFITSSTISSSPNNCTENLNINVNQLNWIWRGIEYSSFKKIFFHQKRKQN